MIHGKLIRRPLDTSTLTGTPFGSLFDRVLGSDSFGSPAWNNGLEGGFYPAVDVYEEEGSFVFAVDLPGLKREDVEVIIEDNVLSLSGSRSLSQNVKEDSYRRLERCYGRFSRHFTLPGNVDSSKVDATFKEGVLEIRVPKSEAAKSRRVEIQ